MPGMPSTARWQDTDRRAMLEFKEITKDFPGTRALEAVSFTVKAGEVVALMGENGAGKSTLMKILSGVWPAGSYQGSFLLSGKEQSFQDTRDAHRAGIAMIHQELAVFPELTVAEHLELDTLPRWIDWPALLARSQAFLDTLGFGLRADSRVGSLSIGARQLVEIARALFRNAQVLIFDEPTSALTEAEVQRLDAIILKLRAEGRAILYITHRMDEVFRLADRLVVLRDGRNAGEISAWKGDVRAPRAEVEPKLISWMVGRSVDAVYPPLHPHPGPVAFKVEDLVMHDPKGRHRLKGLTFEVRAGEILGLAGLLGAGRSEVFEALFGVLSGKGPKGPGFEVSGRMAIATPAGRRRLELPLADPAVALRERLAFVSEDRKGSGLVLDQSILSNLLLPGLVAGTGGLARGRGLLARRDPAQERAQAEKLCARLRVKCASLDQAVGELSGGNQQKVVIAKWLLTEPRVLFLDEPTRGIDIGAKAEIYQLIQDLASEGLAIVLASSEMPELLGTCHRIQVMREGTFSAEVEGRTADQETLMRAASL
jgi:putative multiple sugar transport system ATP-binding protein